MQELRFPFFGTCQMMLTRIAYLVTFIVTHHCVTNNWHKLFEAELKSIYNEETQFAFLRGRKYTQDTR